MPVTPPIPPRAVHARLIGLALLALTAAAPGAPYSRLAGLMQAFRDLPARDRDKIALVLRVVHKDPLDHRPIRLWVESGAARTDIPVSADGRLDLPVRQDWIDGDARLHTDQPPGTSAMDIDLTIMLPAGGGALAVDYLKEALRQAQVTSRAGARRAAGWLAIFAAPTVDGLAIKPGRCCGERAELRSGDRRQVIPAAADGGIVVPSDALTAFAGGTLTITGGTPAISAHTS